MEAVAITGIIAGVTALSVAVLTHVKHSECGKCFKMDTRTPPTSPVETRGMGEANHGMGEANRGTVEVDV